MTYEIRRAAILFISRADFFSIMDRWSGEHRAFAIKAYLECEKSLQEARRKFCSRYNLRRLSEAPSVQLIRSWFMRFEETGSTLNKRIPGRARSVTTAENVERLRDAVNRNPRRSIRKHAAVLGIKKSSVHTILKKIIHFHPYKIQIVQKLRPNDYPSRRTFAQQMLQSFPSNHRLSNIFFSDEAHFHLDGYVNKQNYRYWAPNNPHNKHSKSLHTQKVTVWCAISGSSIIGPYFFEDAVGRSVTVSSVNYCEMIQNFFLPRLQNCPFVNRNTWFQQDGATAHTARITIEMLRNCFPEKFISRFGDMAWPARSPDLSPCDYFLWGYLKSKVYGNEPQDLAQLKRNIRTEIRNISPDLCRRVFANLRFRLEECIQYDGHHLDNIIFKK